MKIQYLGHSCFRIISSCNTAVICDPFDGNMVGFEMPKLSCDVVTVSHRHRDHDFAEGISGSPAVLEKDVYLAADDIAIQSVRCFHDDQKGKLRGENYAFCFLVDGLKVVHMGDIGEVDENLIKKIYGCDVLMLPVGGVFTVDAKAAKIYVDKVRPKIVLPMHYKTDEHNFEIGGLSEFTKLFPPENVQYVHGETLVLEDAPTNIEPKIVVLDRY